MADRTLPAAGSASPPNDAGYNLQTTNSPFSFTITRNGSSSNDAPLFSTKGQRLIFKVWKRKGPSSLALLGSPERAWGCHSGCLVHQCLVSRRTLWALHAVSCRPWHCPLKAWRGILDVATCSTAIDASQGFHWTA